jgi:hypothetical protein
MIKQTIRSAPYYNVCNKAGEYALMRNLRRELGPRIKRRMRWHHLSNFTHDFIPAYVAKHKQAYPWYVRTDVSRFYPCVCYDALQGALIKRKTNN